MSNKDNLDLLLEKVIKEIKEQLLTSISLLNNDVNNEVCPGLISENQDELENISLENEKAI